MIRLPRRNPHPRRQHIRSRKHDDAIIEIRGPGRHRLRPKRPEERVQRVEYPGDVDRGTPLPQRPARGRERGGVVYAAPEDAADGDCVGEEDCDGAERGDGEEGLRGADVDERHEHGEGAGEQDGVYGEVQRWVDVGDPRGEGRAAVAGECPEFSGSMGWFCLFVSLVVDFLRVGVVNTYVVRL